MGVGFRWGSLKIARRRSTPEPKYDSEAFVKAVGLNGVGIKAVNALSSRFHIAAFREGKDT